MKRFVIFLSLLFFLLDLAHDGCLGRPKCDLKPGAYKSCASSQDHHKDLEDSCGENDLAHWGTNFKIDLKIADFPEISSQFENNPVYPVFQDVFQINARKIIITCRIAGSGAIPL